MGPGVPRPLVAVLPLLMGAALFGLFSDGTRADAQVFVVGMKTATAGVTTDFHPTHVELPDGLLDERGRQELIRDLEAEQGFAHRELPMGAGLVLFANGRMIPRDMAYREMLYEKGSSAGPGDRVQITGLGFRDNRLIIDFNGGPYAKHRFLSHISIDDMQLAQRGPIATGCRVTLIFEGGVPDVTAAEVKALLDPVVDFRAKSSAEAYADSLPPKVRDAVQAHEVLVGMSERMVLAAMGEPKTKHREHTVEGDENSPLYEEWIYGEVPKPIQFVRFREGRVVRLEIAALGKPIEVHDKDELGLNPEPVLQARTILNGDAPPGTEGNKPVTKAPTLAKPGEVIAGATPGLGKVNLPGNTPAPDTPTATTQPASAEPSSAPKQQFASVAGH